MTNDDREMEFPDHRPKAVQPKWRRDFPIQVPEDDWVSRRDFAKFAVLASGACATGQVWIAVETVLDERTEPLPATRVASLAELPPDGVLRFHYPTEEDPNLLVRLESGALVAFSQTCTHLACAVQPDLERGRFVCPCHHAFFDLETGTPLSGPARRPLPRIRLEVRDGLVYATGVELRT